MANNRLYVGNMETLEFACISKDAENGTWRQINETGLSDLNAILSTDSIWRAKTALVFFTEADSSLYFLFHNKKKPLPLPPTQEERMAIEARAARIIQQANKKAELDFQSLVNDTLPDELGQYLKCEHAQYLSEKARELRQWLENSYKPWLEGDTLATHMLANDQVRILDADFLTNRIAERIAVNMYIEHLANLSNTARFNKK